MKGFTGVSGLEKITDQELEELMNDFDPIEAPPGPYKIQPNVKGKIYTHLPYLRYSGNHYKSSLLLIWPKMSKSHFIEILMQLKNIFIKEKLFG